MAAMSETSAMSPRRSIENLKDFVFKGPFRDQGMPDFTGKLKEEDIPEAAGLHPGHRGRDTAEVTEVNRRRDARSNSLEASSLLETPEGLREIIAQPC